ncbi:hypothetical protein BVL40_09940 [Corynebacterium diphtheriae]|nr:hypothetical protein BVL37_07690 [Corynebacterium diphtheriae]OMO46847.1 hypothetical protein BVL40_09940 [Corynebacterium diphtheriae]RKW85282.1 hypothetical protein D9B95_04915 [Corynebacterium diphtheriae]RKX07896.1 hypothetical protein D9B98_04790 [Corynebacterium diphtheriae]RNF48734.1 hypothetical protein EFE11_04935 [Corynebacterium diphtheriae]
MLVEHAADPLDGIQVPVSAEKFTITSVCGRAPLGRKSWVQFQDLVGFEGVRCFVCEALIQKEFH